MECYTAIRKDKIVSYMWDIKLKFMNTNSSMVIARGKGMGEERCLNMR